MEENLTQNTPQNSVQQEFVPPSKPANKSFPLKWLSLGIGLILILILLAGTYFLGKNSSSKTSTNQEQTTNAPTPTPTLDPTASWKTYTSTKAGYSFKYPADWPLVNVTPSIGCESCVEEIQFTLKYNLNSVDSTIAVIMVGKRPEKTFNDYLNWIKSDTSKTNIAIVEIDGTKAISYKLTGGIPPLPIINYSILKNGFAYDLWIYDSNETNKNRVLNLDNFDKLISTFKFTQ